MPYVDQRLHGINILSMIFMLVYIYYRKGNKLKLFSCDYFNYHA
jgi:hypothetical protein